jgi:signal transduction histidine kinase
MLPLRRVPPLLAVGVIATILLTLSSSWPMTWLAVFVVLGCLFYFALQIEDHRQQLQDLQRLRSAYDQLDQQAKLIIRTDFELHRTQEELDRRIASLMSLHELGHQLEVSLRPEEIFSKFDASIVTNFGFSYGLLGACVTLETIEWRSLVGVSDKLAQDIKSHLEASGLLKRALTSPAPSMLQSASANDPSHQTLLGLLNAQVAVIAGIIPHTGPAGVLLLGRAGSALANPKAEEELVAILTNQLARAVESSALYEQTWSSQRALEAKVQERTRELAEANESLVRLNKAKSDFVSVVSHELRTPLAAIKGYAALLGSGQFGEILASQRERIAKIEKHADLLTRLINNLLDIARIESGRISMERRLIPVDEFLAIVHDMVRPQLEAKRIRYTANRNGVTELMGDAQHLQRAFINLLSNAVKYTPEGGAVELDLKREGPSILATVRDSGLGIAPEDLPKLFQEFYRANDPINQRIRGTGLGLALVKRIVEAHRGEISVKSEKNRGSAFTIRLPAE